jgi:cytochrome c oxidase subunit 2
MINKLLGIAENAAEHGFMVDHMLEIVHWFMAALFVGWSAFFVFVLWRFRKKKQPVADYHGVRSHTSTHLEVGVVIIEAALLLGLAFPLWSRQVNSFPTGDEVTRVRVIGEQFKWNMHYPGPDGVFGRQDPRLVDGGNPVGIDRSDANAKDDFVMPNELHLPVNKPAILEISSKDVIHNFALYTMRVAQDAIPGSRIPMWFTPVKTGEWEVICGQLCGSNHYAMKANVVVETEDDYQTWLKSKTTAAAP